MIKILEPNFKHEDERGTLVQLVREGYKQINVISSQANTFRGGHYHKINIEAFYVIYGKFDVELIKDDETSKYTFQTGDMFLIEPNVLHNFYYLEDTLLVGMYDKGVELGDGKMDIYEKD